MLLNGSALNGAALNASARSTFILAFCAAVASADVAAAGAITRYCGSAVAASCEIATSPNQHYAAVAAFSGSASVIAAPPYQTFASASVAVSTGEGSAAGDVTRYCLAGIAGSASVAPAAWLNQKAAGDFAGSGSVAAINSVRRPGVAAVACECSIAATSFGIRRGLAGASCSASLAANGVHALRANAAAGGAATISVNAGYGIPSATIVLSAAQVYAYAKATRMAFATPRGSASVTATGRLDAYGVANLSCSAQASAWVIQMQGESNAAAGSASVVPDATYIHMSAGGIGGAASVAADGDITRYVQAAIGGSAALRVETQVNNLLEGFALPNALSTVTLNALGVVVAPLISHFDGSASIVASGTYRHMAHAAGGASASVIAAGTYEYMGAAAVSSAATINAAGRFLWGGTSAIHAQAFDVEAYPALRQLAGAEGSSGAEVTSAATRITRATVAGSASAEIDSAPLITRYGLASVPGVASIAAVATTVGNPDARDPDERTMRRPFTDRTMRRPFVDRTMKATRT